MGEVYEAEHLRLGRRFAVKILKSRVDQQAIERFDRESRAIARLDSECVVGVVDAGLLEDDTPFLVMERLIGTDLRGLLNEYGRLPIPRAVSCIQQACRGIAAAHRASVVHRDLKPENLFVVARDDGTEQCKVLDFGVAKLQTSEFTQQGAVIGTIKYMAPEQLTDSASVGPETDVYALGAILFECLTGEAPHDASNVQQTMFKILNHPPPSARDERPEVPSELDALLLRAMAPEPSARFRRAEDFARALLPFCSPRTEARSDTSRLDEVTGVIPEDQLPTRPARRLRRTAPLFLALGATVGVPLGFALARVSAPAPAAVVVEQKPKADPLPTATIAATPAAPVLAPVAPSPRITESPAPAPPRASTPVPRPPVSRAQPLKSSESPAQLPGVSYVRENPYANQGTPR
jgi:serine/threonine-protein kinase